MTSVRDQLSNVAMTGATSAAKLVQTSASALVSSIVGLDHIIHTVEYVTLPQLNTAIMSTAETAKQVLTIVGIVGVLIILTCLAIIVFVIYYIVVNSRRRNRKQDEENND